jgi:hypothetical protein
MWWGNGSIEIAYLVPEGHQTFLRQRYLSIWVAGIVIVGSEYYCESGRMLLSGVSSFIGK